MRALGVLAGADMPPEALERWAASADLLLAADAGVDRLRAIGRKPHVLIGDMDSAVATHNAESVECDVDQESTDCDKLLARAERHGLASITLACVEGDQLDHMLATLHSALRSPLDVRFALRTGVGWALTPGERRVIPTAPGRRVSLIPILPSAATLGGVVWPLTSAELAPLGPTSISNEAAGDTIEASLQSGAAFLFVEFPWTELPFWE